jgi:hypothetical protein
MRKVELRRFQEKVTRNAWKKCGTMKSNCVQINSAVKAAIMTGKKDEKGFMNFLTLSMYV